MHLFVYEIESKAEVPKVPKMNKVPKVLLTLWHFKYFSAL